ERYAPEIHVHRARDVAGGEFFGRTQIENEQLRPVLDRSGQLARRCQQLRVREAFRHGASYPERVPWFQGSKVPQVLVLGSGFSVLGSWFSVGGFRWNTETRGAEKSPNRDSSNPRNQNEGNPWNFWNS